MTWQDCIQIRFSEQCRIIWAAGARPYIIYSVSKNLCIFLMCPVFPSSWCYCCAQDQCGREIGTHSDHPNGCNKSSNVGKSPVHARRSGRVEVIIIPSQPLSFNSNFAPFFSPLQAIQLHRFTGPGLLSSKRLQQRFRGPQSGQHIIHLKNTLTFGCTVVHKF